VRYKKYVQLKLIHQQLTINHQVSLGVFLASTLDLSTFGRAFLGPSSRKPKMASWEITEPPGGVSEKIDYEWWVPIFRQT
jgi:hypothetical protein